MIASTVPAASRPGKGWMEVFSLVSVEGQAIPDAAASLRLPPEKVRQSRDGVLAWLATNKPLLGGISRDEGLRLSEVVARERLEHLYALAMEAWQNSMEDEVTTRQEGVMARTTRVVKKSHGKISYLNLAAKISHMLHEVPIRFLPGWMEEGSEAEADVDFQLDAGERYQREQQHRYDLDDAANGPSHPPVRACSPESPFGVPGTSELLEGFDAMLRENETSANIMEKLQRDSQAHARLFSPVHPDDEATGEDDEESFDEVAERVLQQPVQLKETPPTMKPTGLKRPLNRKERKARQRLLEKAKKRASG